MKKSIPKKLVTIASYQRAQTKELAAICKILRAAIETHLPEAKPKIYHGSPAWFIGENAVVGFHVSAKNVVNLLFWNGQALREPLLEPVGKFQAARLQFGAASEIDAKVIRRCLKKAGENIWDLDSLRKKSGQRRSLRES